VSADDRATLAVLGLEALARHLEQAAPGLFCTACAWSAPEAPCDTQRALAVVLRLAPVVAAARSMAAAVPGSAGATFAREALQAALATLDVLGERADG